MSLSVGREVGAVSPVLVPPKKSLSVTSLEVLPAPVRLALSERSVAGQRPPMDCGRTEDD